MAFFNQFSYLLLAVVLGVMLFIGLGYVPNLAPIVRIALSGVYVLGAVFINAQFHYPDSPVEVETVADVEAVLSNNKPTFVMLYSNF